MEWEAPAPQLLRPQDTSGCHAQVGEQPEGVHRAVGWRSLASAFCEGRERAVKSEALGWLTVRSQGSC